MAKQPGNGVAAIVEQVPLSTDEATDLTQHEATIEKGLGTFIEVGNALLDISERRLYRASHKGFEAYCRERWNFTRARAYQLIEAARINENLSTRVDTPDSDVSMPTSEKQVRPLAGLAPEKQREAWSQASAASKNGKPTPKDVKRAADKVSGRADRRAAPPKSKPKPPPPKPDPKAVDAVLGEDEDEERQAISAEANGEAVEPDEPEETETDRDTRETTEWLESIPLRAKLTQRCRAIFDDDALAYREANDLIVPLRQLCQRHEKKRPPGQKVGAWLGQIGTAVRMPHPRGGEKKGTRAESGWLGCLDCVRDGKHTGLTSSRQDCPACKGRGYHIPGVRS